MISVEAFWQCVRTGAADVNTFFCHEKKPMTMLMYAVLIGNCDLLKDLLLANANPNLKTTANDAALFIAVRTWGTTPSIFNRILSHLQTYTAPSIGMDWDIRTTASMNAIHLASALNMTWAYTALQSAGVPISSKTNSGQTATFYSYQMNLAII